MVDKNYAETAKRLFLGGSILFYLSLMPTYLSDRNKKIAYSIIVIGFFYTIAITMKLYKNQGLSRLEVNTVATMVAYIYAIQSLCTIFILMKFKFKFKELIVIITIVLSYYIIILTQTRSVMLTYPLFVITLLFKERFFNIKSFSALFIILLIGFFSNISVIKDGFERIVNSKNEIQRYQNNDDNTSLGARFSMWKAGGSIFTIHNWGVSADERYIQAKEYIIKNENSNPEALRSIAFHFHNDFLDAATLRGILGVVTLLFFYFAITITSYKITKEITIILLLIAPSLLYGLTDTLFIDHRYVTVFILLLPVYLFFNGNESNYSINTKEKTKELL